ncbi:MAG: toprim domain-containing protein [bacterium]
MENLSLGDKAEGHWDSILRQIGVEAKILNGKHQPCPSCGGRDRFRYDNKKNRGDYYCSQCGPGDGFKLLMAIHQCEFAEAAKMVEEVIGRAKPDEKKEDVDPRKRLQYISKHLVRVSAGDPVYIYLKSRGLSKLPRTLRLHPKLAYYEGREKIGSYPAMISLVRDNEGNALTYHVTYLTSAGHKAHVGSERKVLSALGDKGYVSMLYPAKETLGVAEGIETSIASRVLFDVPVWATLNSNGMKAFLPPPEVRRVMIFADNDKNYEGQSAAYQLAHKLCTKGIEVEVVIPPPGDWNDELVRRIRLQR